MFQLFALHDFYLIGKIDLEFFHLVRIISFILNYLLSVIVEFFF